MKIKRFLVCFLSAVFCLGVLTDCGSSSYGKGETEQEWQIVNNGVEFGYDCYGVADYENECWAAYINGASGYIFDPAIVELDDISLKKGTYEFRVSSMIDNNKIAYGDNSLANDMVMQMRVIAGAGDNEYAVASKEIYRWDYRGEREWQDFSLPFLLKSSADVRLEVRYLNRASIFIKTASVNGIEPSAALTTDYVSYFTGDEFKADKEAIFEEDTLYYLDLYEILLSVKDSVFAYDLINMVSCVQGLANRDGERLFIRFSSPNDYTYSPDELWLTELRKENGYLHGKKICKIKNPFTVLRLFDKYINGLVVWDPSVPATSNVALTDCGVSGNIPVRYSENYQSVYTLLTEKYGIVVALDLNGRFHSGGSGKIWNTGVKSTGSAKNDAYNYAIEKYLRPSLASATLTACHLDAYSWDTTGLTVTYHNIEQQYLANNDYYVMNKAFFWDLYPLDDVEPTDDPEQEVGTDYKTLIEILSLMNRNAKGELFTVGGFYPQWIKYSMASGGAVEETLIELAFTTLYGEYYGVLDADAYGYTNLANASVYSRIPQPANGYKAKQRGTAYGEEENAVKARAEKYIQTDPETGARSIIPNNYVVVYMGDYDSAAWPNMVMYRQFGDEPRGETPLCWPISPLVYKRIPHVVDYMYKNQSMNDYFVGCNNGYGYMGLTALESPLRSGLSGSIERYMRVTQSAYDFYDLDTLGFLINTTRGVEFSDKLINLISDIAPYGVKADDGTMAGVHYNSKGEAVVWSPIINMSYSSNPADAAQDLMAQMSVPIGSPFFVQLRGVLKSRTYIEELMAHDTVKNVLKIQPLDPYVYDYLLKAHYGVIKL